MGFCDSEPDGEAAQTKLSSQKLKITLLNITMLQFSFLPFHHNHKE